MVALGMLVFAGALVAAIGRTATLRGRSALIWCLLAIVIGSFGFVAGSALMGVALGGDLDNHAAFIAVFLPAIMTLAPMAVMFFVLTVSPVVVKRRAEWPMTFFGLGEGSAAVRDDVVRLTWEGGGHEIARSQLRTIEADGETVRLVATIDGKDVSLTMIPGGGPDSRDMRIAQSRLFAETLRGELPKATALR